MDRSRVLTLVQVDYIADEIGQQLASETRREVFCNITSVSESELFEGGKIGLHPEYRATIFAPDYEGEQIAELDGVRYGIYRTYLGKREMIELYLERRAGI